MAEALQAFINRTIEIAGDTYHLVAPMREDLTAAIEALREHIATPL